MAVLYAAAAAGGIAAYEHAPTGQSLSAYRGGGAAAAAAAVVVVAAVDDDDDDNGGGGEEADMVAVWADDYDDQSKCRTRPGRAVVVAVGVAVVVVVVVAAAAAPACQNHLDSDMTAAFSTTREMGGGWAHTAPREDPGDQWEEAAS